MASRRRARQYALQALFQADVSACSAVSALAGLWDGQLDVDDDALGGRAADEEEVDFASELAAGVEGHLDAIDAAIEASSTNWRIRRMAVVDRNVLRLGTFEILYRDDIPHNVTINEAVEMAKLFGSKESGSFVNGVLDRIARDRKR